MCIKRIATLLLALLGYIALAGATQSLIAHFVPKPNQQRYAELRVGPSNQIQVLICKDWVLEPEDMDSGQESSSAETGQDVYYWINLVGNPAASTFTNCDVHANGPVRQRPYNGAINLEPTRSQITINLQRTASNHADASGPCPANGTYRIRKITKDPFLTKDSI